MLTEHAMTVLAKHKTVYMRHELKRARQKAGLIQAQMAAIAGIDRSTYAHIELGDRDPSFDAACHIAARLSRRVRISWCP